MNRKFAVKDESKFALLIEMKKMVTNEEKLASHFGIIANIYKNDYIKDTKAFHDCNIRDCQTLKFIGKEQKSMIEISSFLNLTPGTTTQYIDGLIAKNFVQRTFDENDRRKVLIALNKKGFDLLNNHNKQHIRVSKEILEHLSQNEQKDFISLLDKVTIGIKKNMK